MNDENPSTEAPDLSTETADIRDVSYVRGAWQDELGNPLNDGDEIANESGEFTLRIRNYESPGGTNIAFEHTPFRGTPDPQTVVPTTHTLRDVNIASRATPDTLTVYPLALGPTTRITLTLTKKGNK